MNFLSETTKKARTRRALKNGIKPGLIEVVPRILEKHPSLRWYVEEAPVSSLE